MTDSDDPQTEDEQPAPEGGEEDIEGADLPLRADGGVAVPADPSIQGSPTGSPEPSAPPIEDSTNQNSEGSQTSDGYDRTHPALRPKQRDRVQLAPFEELCGRLIDLHRTEFNLVIQLSSGLLEFPLNSAEAAICEDDLAGKAGYWVSILRISDPDNPVLVNSLESTEDT